MVPFMPNRQCTIAAMVVVLLLLVGFLAAPNQTLAGEVTISVQANQPWTDTGLDLKQGDHVTIAASDTIKIAGSDLGKTPAGDQGCIQAETGLAPGLTCNSLIGHIGDGAPFQIGTNLSLSVQTTGRLYLGGQ